jgi:hypothetical protein
MQWKKDHMEKQRKKYHIKNNVLENSHATKWGARVKQEL